MFIEDLNSHLFLMASLFSTSKIKMYPNIRFLQWFRSELLSRACRHFCGVCYSYLTAEVITGNAFLYEENDDMRAV